MHPIHALLRARTASVHAVLDARFATGLHGPGRYAAYLLGMHRTIAAFEAAPVPSDAADAPIRGSRAALLQADLDALGLQALEPASVAFATDAEWFGGWYVVEGSALGAAMMLRDMRERMPPHDMPLRFLQAHARPGGRWRNVLAQVLSRPDTDAPSLCTGAVRMFTVAEASFARADRRTA